MGRGWKRARKLSTAPVPYPTTLLQVDQAAPADQGVLRIERERSEDPDLDRVSVYVLVAIVRKRLGLETTLYQILQVLSISLFEKTPILRALQAYDSQTDSLDPRNQLILFDF